MAYNGKEITIDDFSGGYCGALSPFSLELNQATDLANVVVKPGGKGIRMLWGYKQLNASPVSVATASKAAAGIGFDASNKMTVISDGKCYFSNVAAGFGTALTFSDITGAYTTLASETSALWNFILFNNKQYGASANPDTNLYNDPIYVSGSSVAAWPGLPTFGSGEGFYGCFTANNRAFGYGGNKIWWSVLGDAEDFTGTGSGSTTVGNLGDDTRDFITGIEVINENIALIFRRYSTWQMILTEAPFPVYPLFPTVGNASKFSTLNVDGTIYFVSAEKRMMQTDGVNVKPMSPNANNLFDQLYSFHETYLYREVGPDYDWVVCHFPVSSTRPQSLPRDIVWDLENECWLVNKDIPVLRIAVTDPKGVAYGIDEDGYVFNPQYYTRSATVYGEPVITPLTSSDLYGTQSWEWRGGFLNPASLANIVQVARATISFTVGGVNSIRFSYDYDYAPSNSDIPAPWFLSHYTDVTPSSYNLGTATTRTIRLTGRGNGFQWSVNGNNTAHTIHSVVLGGKTYGQKVLAAS